MTGGSQTLERGLSILDLLGGEPQGLRLGEIAAALDLNRTVVHRLVTTLVDTGYVTRVDGSRYRLGVKLVQLSRDVIPNLRQRVRPVLGRLAEEVGGTAHLTIAVGDEAVALEVIEPESTTYHVAYRVGSRHPLDRGASGIAILSRRPRSDDDPPDVRLAREQGWIMTRSQLQEAAVGVAAPLTTEDSVEASIGLVLMGEVDVERLAKAVVAAAASLS